MNENVGSLVLTGLMKFSLTALMLCAWILTSCEDVDQPPPSHRRAPAPTGQAPQGQYPPQQQPFNPNGPAQPDTSAPETAGTPQPAAPTKVAKGDYPYGIPVPNKPHLVESPYSPGKYVDVEGFAPGTEVKDPYTQKIFLVP
jgi:hypothetical protein